MGGLGSYLFSQTHNIMGTVKGQGVSGVFHKKLTAVSFCHIVVQYFREIEPFMAHRRG